MIRRPQKDTLHPRNRFRDGYDFAQLIACSPALAAFVAPNAYGNASIDYANPAAVKALNQALLTYAYGLEHWDVPPGYLCPPIPGRSEYIHHLADLMGIGTTKVVPYDSGTSKEVPYDSGTTNRLRQGYGGQEVVPYDNLPYVLDIGTGANCIYPLIGAREYGWRFVGSETDRVALEWAKKVVAANPSVAALIECRLQPSPLACFEGVVKAGETFDLSMCNPPFHASAEASAEGNQRKRRNLGGRRASMAPVLNFGGQAGELWCEGGELAFIRRMIIESAKRPDLCRWFTTLVSKSTHVAPLVHALEDVSAADVRTLEMTHGQKQSRILAWTFTHA